MEERIYRPGERVGTYEILEHLATGLTAAVYRVRDLEHDPEEWGPEQPTALKVDRFDARRRDTQRLTDHNARLEHEFGLVSTVVHRNVVRVYEQRYHEGAAFYAMELLQGPTLGRFLASQRRGYLEQLLIFRQLARALAACHREGIVHCDVRPSNVLVVNPATRWIPEVEEELLAATHPEERDAAFLRSAPQPVLIDFGMAQVLADPPEEFGAVSGAAEFLTPEHARALRDNPGARVAHRAEPHEDVFQAGVLLYQMLTGRLPTQTPAAQWRALLDERCDAEPVPVLELNPEAPPAFAALAMECLAPDASLRPRDGSALAQRVSEALRTDAERLQGLAPEYALAPETPLSEEPRTASAVASAALEDGADEEEEALEAEDDPEELELENSARGDMAVLVGALVERLEQREPVRQWAQFLGVGLAALGLAVVVALALQLHHVVEHTTGVIDRLDRLSERLVQLEEASRVPANLGRVPEVPVQGGLRMPEEGLPGQLRAPCLVDGQRLRGVKELRGSCWWNYVNPTYLTEPPSRRPCPEPAYDPPPEENDRMHCYEPVYMDKTHAPYPRSLVPARPRR